MRHARRPLLFMWCLALTLPFLGGCRKDAPEADLPPATQEGKNTAGCFIDGQPFVAQSYGGGILSASIPALDGGFSFINSYRLSISGKLNGEAVEVMLFFQGRQTGTYLLNQNTRYYPQGDPNVILNHATFRYVGSGIHEEWGTDAQHTGQVVLTKADVPNGLSAGTFAFTAVSSQNPGKTVVITQGRFDRKY